jgi:uncharacterized protein YutE (UPF0331/DUF86 family)
MTPIDASLIDRKRSIMLRELKLLDELRRRKVRASSDIVLQHALIHSLQNCISAAIDIAQHVGVERTGEVASSYAESIRMLGELKVLSKKFAARFSEVAKLRNVLVHAYENLDVDLVATMVPKFLKDAKVFLTAIKKLTS